MASFINKMKPGKKDTKKKEADAPSAPSGKATFAHPELQAGEMVALSNTLCPIEISSQGFTCEIRYKKGDEPYRVMLKKTGGKVVSDETLNPTDRKKKAVTDFMYKGLFGVHIHPSGILLHLDHEEDFKGEIRKNQPPATLTSKELPADHQELDGKRFEKIDLTKCTEHNPLLISPNQGHYHMQVKPVASEDGKWGLYLSNPKGFVREDSPAVVMLEPNVNILIDRKFFGSRTSGDGGIDARNWNKSIADPVIMRLSVDEDNQLTVEEMFTSKGMTLMLESGKATPMGLPGTGSAEQDAAYQKQFADILLGLLKATESDGKARDLEHDLAKERAEAIVDASRAIQKRNQDGVSKLALELAIKEVLAPFYSGDSGGDTASHQTISLLNAITSEIIGWVEADTSRAIAVSAVEKAISQSADTLPWDDGVEEIMTMDLPDVEASSISGGSNALFGDLVSAANKFITGKTHIRQMRNISKALKATSEPLEQQECVRQFNVLIAEMVTGIFEKTLVCLAVKGHLVDTEEERRNELIPDQSQMEEINITHTELDNVLKKYDGYAQFLERAFDDRLAGSIDTLVQSFQHGSNSEDEHSLTTKPFLNYLIALRSSGGTIGSGSDTSAPAVSSLMGIPDAIPDISVLQPSPGAANGLLRITHREGVLLEITFVLAPRSDDMPHGMSKALWYGFQDLAKFIMAYYLTGESKGAKDQKQVDVIVSTFASTILLKVVNFYRDLNRLPSSEGFEDAVEMIGGSIGLLEVVPGANPQDELLDVHNRTEYISVEPLDIRSELRGTIVALEKEGAVDMGIYRFKQRMRSLAMTGTGKGNIVLMPIKMLAKGGVLMMRAKYNEENFEKVIRLIEPKDGEAGVDDPFGLEVKKSVKKLSKTAIYKLVHGLPFFKNFSTYEKTKISDFDLSFSIYRKGDVILREESQDVAFFIVIKGHVRALKGGCDLQKHGAGDMFGEMAFLTDSPQTMTVEALTNVLVLRVDKEMFSHLGPESREKFKIHIIDRQVRSLAETTQQMQQKMRSEESPATLVEAVPPDHTGQEGEVAQIERSDAITMVDNLSFFNEFSVFEKRRMIAFFTSFRNYQHNSEIIREGGTGTSFFILIKGDVQVIKGNAVIVNLGPGEFFGEMAYLINEARTTSVRSQGEVLALRLDPKLTEKLGAEIREKIKDQFISKLTDRMITTQEMMSKA